MFFDFISQLLNLLIKVTFINWTGYNNQKMFCFWYGFIILFCNLIQQNAAIAKSFSSWTFANSILHKLPIDHDKRNFVHEVKNSIFSQVSPTPLQNNPRLVLCSRSALENCLEISYSVALKDLKFQDFACGNLLLNASLSHRYTVYGKKLLN